MEGGVCRFLFILSLAVLGDHYYSCNGASLDPFPLGTIGCLVSDICDGRETCTNDRLFGSCQGMLSRVMYGEPHFRLTDSEIRQLERQITTLVEAGFTWKDAFTQCILQNTLVSFTRVRSESARNYQLHQLCEDALGVAGAGDSWREQIAAADREDATEEAINSEIASILLRLLASAEDLDSGRPDGQSITSLVPQEESEEVADRSDVASSRLMKELLRSSQKRDEIVQVHKYFDKSKGTWKRDPYFGSYSDDPSSALSQYSVYSDNGEAGNVYATDFYSNTANDNNNNGDDNGLLWDDESARDDDRVSSALMDTRPLGDLMRQTVAESNQVPDSDDIDWERVIDSLVLSEGDKEALQGLLEGSILPRDLDEDQQKRLQVFIEVLIDVLEGDSENLGKEAADPLLLDAAGSMANEDVPAAEQDGAAPILAPEDLFETDPDDSDDLSEDDGENISKTEIIPDDLVDITYSQDSTDVESSKKRAEEGSSDGSEVQVDKKMMNEVLAEEEEAEREPKNLIDPNSMFLQLSERVNLETARDFVRNLSEILDLPPGLIYENRVDPDGSITLKLNPDPEGVWDTETLADKARSPKTNSRLKEMGGITVVTSGFGDYGNRVALKQNNRYVVLTFILVGTIAGVVLAVVTIYLIKRHSRSRHKLQQLASNPDGNEASKDYQDLCRQRMQGKTSEKPEPLHAASRIGSVSEAQVRSPSSRSSTSSWSEEPAASNMDISTGHIVLSYMEDHLKNQDRLDREWEAVSGYVADPCSTRMAQDQANMRKNRFADILPYDHSRVILSSNANVSNSDYINASFITDHDPRNPAYICTQGPLPHTVADFWQMIWEQGSVVIVMLTKLTESGTSLCHRYWPEEGSDLYHIYEVHLVSEHIWCDDYLVRSFYLKNLQTNETRTVTQFHFLTWPELSVPASIKATLDFRRKVNKSFRGRSCPIVVHCSDGCGRSGTYCLIDMVLNKMAKGAKEIDMAATLEHIRDQRMSMVKTKEQFQFSLAAVAEEVHAILKALPQ